MTALPITRVVLYKHGVGYFERQGTVTDDATLMLTFKQSEVSDVLKSLTVLDLHGGHIASVSYDATKPLEQLLSEVALSIPDQGSLVSLLPQLRGARVALHSGVADPVEGSIIGIDTTERQTGDGIVHVVLLSVLTDHGEVRSVDLHQLASVQLCDAALRSDLEYYLRTMLSAKKKEARTFTFFAQGQGERQIRISYTLGAPVWKATYRILLGEESKQPMIQGWAVVDNMQDEDWEEVELSLIAGLPVSFLHDLYTPRYIRRPEVKVQETTGVLPPEVESGLETGEALTAAYAAERMVRDLAEETFIGEAPATPHISRRLAKGTGKVTDISKLELATRSAISSTATQVRERQIGDLFAYEIEHPVTIRRNQSALVPIVLRSFEGKPVLLYNKSTRAENPMRCVEFKNTTGLTLEGGPVTVLEGGSYVGEAMLNTLKPNEQRLVPYAVELSVRVTDNIDSHNDRVHRVIIRNGELFTQYVHVQQTTYHFTNKSDQEQLVYLDHPCTNPEWQLFDTPAPHEITDHYWRFRFPLLGGKTETFVVRQKYTLRQCFILTNLEENELSSWIEQRYLDSKTEKVLRQVVELRQKELALQEQQRRLEEERQNIHNDQARIRENVKSLGGQSTGKELHERFVRKLHAQEDRLEQITCELKEKTEAHDRRREQIDQLLAQLAYDAVVSG